VNQQPDDRTVLGKKVADRLDAPTRIARHRIPPAAQASPEPATAPGIGVDGPSARVPQPALERYVIRRLEPGQSRTEARIGQPPPAASGAGPVSPKKRRRGWLAVVLVIAVGLVISVTALVALVWLLTAQS
jgi:hypothetical protein